MVIIQLSTCLARMALTLPGIFQSGTIQRLSFATGLNDCQGEAFEAGAIKYVMKPLTLKAS